MSDWIRLNENLEVMDSLMITDGDILLLFDNGEVRRLSDEKHPLAIVTHFKSIKAKGE